jgi:hypothetical protein
MIFIPRLIFSGGSPPKQIRNPPACSGLYEN